jgi:secreted trypsin-like serine protease
MNKSPKKYLLYVVSVFGLVFLLVTALSVQAQESDPPPDIVGGRPADPGEWPWQVALISGDATNFWYGQFCGGTLIEEDWVLTAAHCVHDKAAADVDIVAGIYDLWDPAVGYQRREVSQIIVHPDYDDDTSDSDIALLKLSSSVSIGGSGETKTAIIPLVSNDIGSLVGTTSWVTGWGDTESTPTYPDELQEVNVPIISNALCNSYSSYGGAITNTMMCAGYAQGGKDSCQGDSGGPLVINDGGTWKLAGVVSWGIGCADPGYYGVYARVSEFTDWIDAKLCEGVSGPDHDDFASRYVIDNLGVTYETDTKCSTSEVSDPTLPAACGVSGKGQATVWYQYATGATETAISIDTAGSGYDTFVAIWDTSWDFIACNNNGTSPALLGAQVSPNTTYYIEIGQP